MYICRVKSSKSETIGPETAAPAHLNLFKLNGVLKFSLESYFSLCFCLFQCWTQDTYITLTFSELFKANKPCLLHMQLFCIEINVQWYRYGVTLIYWKENQVKVGVPLTLTFFILFFLLFIHFYWTIASRFPFMFSLFPFHFLHIPLIIFLNICAYTVVTWVYVQRQFNCLLLLNFLQLLWFLSSFLQVLIILLLRIHCMVTQKQIERFQREGEQ